MNKKKLVNLMKYIDECKARLAAAPTAKRVKHPKEYYEFWQRELDFHAKKIEVLKEAK